MSRPFTSRRFSLPLAGVLLAGVLLVVFTAAGCGPASSSGGAGRDTTAAEEDNGGVQTGAQAWAADGFARLRTGDDTTRVGVITNHTALLSDSTSADSTSADSATHLIDALDRAEGIEVGALFGPEHGLRGTASAGQKVSDGTDETTGAPVFSLYGDDRKPSQEALEGLDALVYDIQDVGARFYTYVTTMGLSMQAAAEAGLPFYVLDRPDPLGGAYVGGFVLDEAQQSFVGKYPVPMAYGMTPGEMARMIQGESWLEGLDSLRLDVAELRGWERGMTWRETGLDWIAPSPNIPDPATALVYAGAVLFEATSASEGRGTDAPFKLLGAPWADGQALADTLDARGLPGVQFSAAQFTPQPREGAQNPKLAGQQLQGIRYEVTDAEAFRPVEAGIHVLHAFYQQAQRQGVENFIDRPEWLATLAGTERLGQMLRSGARPDEIIAAWRGGVEAFRGRRQSYLLYEGAEGG
jgi:uncharacterized protein YbbC (DUF1343 family)